MIFEKLTTTASSNLEAYYRKKGIALYIDSELKPFGTSHFYLNLGTREPASAYSKGLKSV